MLYMLRFLAIPLLFVCPLILSGCGTYYYVTVDSLYDEQYEGRTDAYCLLPGNPGVNADDLLFRDIARMLVPAFEARGYRVVNQEQQTQHVARIEYWEESPRTILHNDTVRRSVPVVVRDGRRKERIEYVTVEEPTITTQTIYSTGLLVTAYSLPPRGNPKQIWRTLANCSSAAPGLRTQLAVVIPVLAETLGTRTEGGKQFEVFVNDKGHISMDKP